HRNSGGIPGDPYFQILNHSSVSGSPGGFIGGDATIDLNIVNASIAGLFDVEIANFSGGSIGGNAVMNVDAAGGVPTQGIAIFQIRNDDNGNATGGGSIVGDATIDVNVGSLASGPDVNSNALVAQITNTGGSVGSNAIIDFTASGNVDAQGTTFFQVVSNGAGSNIGGEAGVNCSFGGVSAGGGVCG